MAAPRARHGLASPALAALVWTAIVAGTFAGGLLMRQDDHDFRVYMDAGQRMLDGKPLYLLDRPADSWHVTNQDLQGPPFQGLFFVPLAALARANYTLARTAWDGANLVLLVAGFAWWVLALGPALPGAGPLWRSHAALVSLAAVSVPIFANFRNMNTTALMFCLLGATACALTRGRTAAAGISLGAATAIKAFPALLILCLLVKREWRAAGVAIVTAGALTALLLPVVGVAEYADTVRAWLAHTEPAAWPEWSQNQSVAMLARRVLPSSLEPAVLAIWSVVLLGGLVLLIRATPAPAIAADLALATTLTVLLSPIAWNHYFFLLFPALVYAYAYDGPSQRRRRHGVVAALVLLSALSRFTLGDAGAETIRLFGHCVIAAVIAAVAVSLALRETAAPPRTRRA